MTDSGLIEQRAGYLSVDCGRCDDARPVSELYRTFAVECVTKQVDRVLIRAADCGPEGRHALRDALTVMLLGGIAPGFRLAMVTRVARIHSYFLELQRDLRRLGIHLALFAEEGEAVQWLQAKVRGSLSGR